MVESQPNDKLRLDKWLWTARFYKTRSLAAEAVKGGKIVLNGAKAKPAKIVQAGDALRIRRKPYEYQITVLAIAKNRGPVSEAVKLYQEHPDSILRREEITRQKQAEAAVRPKFPGRPSKRDRRALRQFTGKSSVDPEVADDL